MNKIKLSFLYYISILKFYGNAGEYIQNAFTSRDYMAAVSHGFCGVKTIDLLIKKCKSDNSGGRLSSHILWNLIKFDFRIEKKITSRKSYFVSVRPFYFDYNDYFIPNGCIDGYPSSKCILRKVGCCGIGFGINFYYNKFNAPHTFSHSLCFYLNVLAKKIIPFDVIISYSPFIFCIPQGIYIEFNLINFSIGNFIKSFIMSFVDLNNQPEANWKPRSFDGNDIDRAIRYMNKVNLIHSNDTEKAKFILLDNFLLTIFYNIRIYIGIKS